MSDWSDLDARAALLRFGSEGAATFDRLVAISSAGEVTGRIRAIPTTTLDLAPLPGADGRDGERDAVFAFARQFVTDVSSLDDATRAAFTAACGGATFGVVQALWVADMAPRVIAVLGALFEGPGDWPTDPPTAVDAMTSWAAVDDFLREVHRLDGLDPVLTEIVRLRGARHHDCRLCKSIRSRPALAAGATEDLFGAIDVDGQPGLSEVARAAVALTDAMVWHPARIHDALVDDVRRNLSPAQAVELVLDVMRNAANKIAVALGADAPHVAEGTEVYEIDADGVAHYGLDAPA